MVEPNSQVCHRFDSCTVVFIKLKILIIEKGKVRNKMNKWLKVSQKFLSKNASTILTCVGAAGVVTTSVMAAKATPKALSLIEEAKQEKGEELSKWETIRTVAPVYAPSVFVGAATVSAIFGANILNKRSQAALMSAYALIDQKFKDHKNKVTELYGEDSNTNITKEIAKDDYEDAEIDDMDSEEDDGKKLFYDVYSKRYFRATNETVLQTSYEINKAIQLYGGVTLNTYYRSLGLPETEDGEIMGWSCGQLMETYWENWLDFHYEHVEIDGGIECCLITLEFEPAMDFDDY